MRADGRDGRCPHGTPPHIDRWLRARLVVREHLLGQAWVTPTRQGLALAGLDFALWELPQT